jgi:D-alanyl-lipoteichoic acid acyltransferase DltB (MBOAT superfamily)
MGFRLMDNFHRPYFAGSVADFWRRWHISLSAWFRDYLYLPLGGSRVPLRRWVANVLIVFLVSGLWHGAGWTFAIWGLLHGGYLVIGRLTARVRERLAEACGLARHPRLRHGLKVLTVFHLVLAAWVFFRADSLAAALRVFGSMALLAASGPLVVGMRREEFLVALAALAVLAFVHLLQRHWHVRHFLADQPAFVRWGVAYGLVIGIVLFGEFRRQPFIYFQF